MKKEDISKLFQLLGDKKKHEESAHLASKAIGDCQKANGFLCNSYEHDICHDCAHQQRLSLLNQIIVNTNGEIADLVEFNALELAKMLKATGGECEEWLRTTNDCWHRLTGENNSLYTSFAKELGVKL